MNNLSKTRLAIASVVLLVSIASPAQWFDQGAVLSVTEENDIVATTDRHYSQGFKLAYLGADNYAPDWLKRAADKFPAFGYAPHALKLGIVVGQNIFTPDDLETVPPLATDRPYAGWLYAGFLMQRRGLTEAGRPVFESCQMELGVVGPPSLAEDAQVWIHPNRPRGWNYQLKTEAGFVLKYLRAWLISPQLEGPRTFDFIPHVGVSLGNIDTSLRVGAVARVGINLPEDFGLQPINSLATTEGGWSPNRRRIWGFYIFGGVQGRAVGYNEFLDGNLFRHSRGVTPEPLVAQLSGGVVVTWNRIEIGAAGIFSTDEFKGQRNPDAYGSLFLKVKF